MYVYTYVAKNTGRVPSHRLLPIFDCLMVTRALGHMRMVMPKYMNYHEAIGRLEINAGRAHCLSFLLDIFEVDLTSVGFEHSVCHETLLTSFTYIHI